MYHAPSGFDPSGPPPDRRRRVRAPFRQTRRPEERITLLGEPVDLVRPEEVLLHVERSVEAGVQSVVANHNLHSLYLIRRTPGMRRLYDAADLIELDSTPLIHFARLLGHPARPQHRCTYLDWRDHFWSLADRKGMGFALIVLDLDHFKSINDHCGHEEGDRVLCEVAQLLRRTLRPSDIAGRWGGEEFLVVMPETTQEQATEVARRLMSELKTIKLQASGEPPVQAQVPLTVRASLGLTTHKAGESYEATLHRADDAMYRAKEQGRDRLVIL